MRQRNRDRIQRLHGTIQLLDVAYPVEIDRLYVDVNILSEPTSYNHSEIEDLLQNSDHKKNVESPDLHSIIKVIEDHQKLMVLGKPGAGKSTFLQHVIIECNNGDLLSDHVPILIKLRDYVRKARRDNNFSFKHYIYSFFKDVSQQELEVLLNDGRVLLLLDGLDEVPEANMDRVIDEIDYLIEDHPLIRFIVTCRILGGKYKFNNFTYAEIADFLKPQIISFSEKWFAASYNNNLEKGKIKAQKFMNKLKLPENKQIYELVKTPLLLSLVCKIFSFKHQFYSQRYKVYEQGIEILLSKWDESRRIKRDQLYKDLNIEEKVKLLSYIAYRKFEQEQYLLFEKKEILQYISDYLDIPEEDSHAVLTSIIQQHGFLIPRAQLIYSFSHLTFQEYFIAKWYVENKDYQRKLIDCITKNTKNSGKQVLFIFVEMLPQCDSFLVSLKKQIDAFLESDEIFQQFMNWIFEKSFLLNSQQKAASIRALYFEFSLETKSTKRVSSILDDELEISLEMNQEKQLYLDICFFNILSFIKSTILGEFNNYYFCQIFNKILRLSNNEEFKEKILILKSELPTKLFKREQIKDWWISNGENWTNTFEYLINKHYHFKTWQFKREQMDTLQHYYYANEILITCLNSKIEVSSEIKKIIEETLFLPIAEIEKRKQSNS